jgi:hypothetical protein
VVQTADDAARAALKTKLRTMAARARFPARVHVTQSVFSAGGLRDLVPGVARVAAEARPRANSRKL